MIDDSLIMSVTIRESSIDNTRRSNIGYREDTQ